MTAQGQARQRNRRRPAPYSLSAMIQRVQLSAAHRLNPHDHQRAQRVVGIVLWVVFFVTLLGIGALGGS